MVFFWISFILVFNECIRSRYFVTSPKAEIINCKKEILGMLTYCMTFSMLTSIVR